MIIIILTISNVILYNNNVLLLLLYIILSASRPEQHSSARIVVYKPHLETPTGKSFPVTITPLARLCCTKVTILWSDQLWYIDKYIFKLYYHLWYNIIYHLNSNYLNNRNRVVIGEKHLPYPKFLVFDEF